MPFDQAIWLGFPRSMQGGHLADAARQHLHHLLLHGHGVRAVAGASRPGRLSVPALLGCTSRGPLISTSWNLARLQLVATAPVRTFCSSPT